MATRSAVIVTAHSDAGGNFLVKTCPDGHVILVKSIMVVNNAAIAQVIQISFQRPADGTFVTPFRQNLQPNTSSNLDMWGVLEPGDNLYFAPGAGGVQLWVSGAILPEREGVPTAEL